MRKLSIICVALLLTAVLAGGLTACDSQGADERESQSAEETEEGQGIVTLNMYITAADGNALGNAEIKVNNSGEELTYITDYMGYVSIPHVLTDSYITVWTENSQGETVASGEIRVVYGTGYSFDDKDNSKESLTVPEKVTAVSARLSVTENGTFTCTYLS